ncbi:ATP synthase F0 subcomplex B subunit [Aliiroseovarius sediminilitoris]|jgi:F-type H+-transporting ATPase subunit b|uniref:ATP synthase subunit b n=1 Tax=Aliiroseovarius sediminilitoris TaxID=1173584 RepID=A0A1I0QME5_9RHOB|nr:ATP F0F1 synthase subunit B [Aliiroseovarius sediminilitoris]SEW28514.1 ATP synthase F0 subcomplex B subunit [Aliiroseovarius sediminilitoris]
MKTFTLAPLFLVIAAPAFAAEKTGWADLANTDTVVVLAFLLFVTFLGYMGVHKMLGSQLDNRAEGIKSELEEARALREEAQTILASYERKQKEVAKQAERIVAHAKEEAANAATAAKEDLKASIARRLAAAEDQIVSAQSAAVKEVRDTAAQVAVAAARDVIATQMTATEGNSLIDDAIKTVEAKLH